MVWMPNIHWWFDGKFHALPRTQPPPRCGTLTHDNHDTALLRHPQGLNWAGELTWTEGGTAIIDGEKGDLEPNEGDSG